MGDKHMDREESNISHKIEDSILQVTVDGSVTVSDILGYAQNYIDVWAHSPRVLWDFRLALFSDITSETYLSMSGEFTDVFRVKAGWHTERLHTYIRNVMSTCVMSKHQK